MITYKAFGLKIASEIILDELMTCQCEEPGLVITQGRVPDFQVENTGVMTRRRIEPDKFWLEIPGVARYYVENGNHILVEPKDTATQEEVKLYLLGSCMGVVLFQKRILPLHGSCMDVGGQGLLLTGKSGAGKSTIATAICQKGYRLLTDDVAAVRVAGVTEPTVYPGYPGQKLWEDALERTGKRGDKKSLNRISNHLAKYSIKSHEYFCDKEMPIGTIVEIVPGPVEQIEITEVRSTDKINLILQNTYRPRFPGLMGLEAWHFKNCVTIGNQITAYRITRPQGQHLEERIADLILEKLL